MAQFHVGLKRVVDDSYDIKIGRDLFHTLITDLKSGLIQGVTRWAVITDSKVKEKYGDQLLEQLKANGLTCDLFYVQNGEKSKTRETKAFIEDQMFDKGYGRDSGIIALGGGMVSDLAGFIASTFCRGVPYINYSTTLLSAADASVGGKTAVDTPAATNMVGAFYQPTKVYIDLNTWQSLSIREFRSGLAETIKHACMADAELFYYLEQHMDKIITSDCLVLDPEVCEHIAYKNCQIKFHVVEQDERESNLRQILNLGHTAGRAIEALSNYELLHGEAVAIGLAVQAKLAKHFGFITGEDDGRISRLLIKAGFDINIPEHITPSMLVKKMHTDKKVRQGSIRFVFMSGIGKMKQFENGSFSKPVDETVLQDILENM